MASPQKSEIVKKYKKVQQGYLNLLSINKKFEDQIEELRQKIFKKDEQRFCLMELLKKVKQNEADKQAEINKLKTSLQQQCIHILDQEAQIQRLTEQNSVLKVKAARNENKSGVKSKLMKNKQNKKNNNTADISFGHPVFERENSANKVPKKQSVLQNFNFSKLDITIGEPLAEDETNNNSLSSAKKKKLYRSDDELVDLM